MSDGNDTTNKGKTLGPRKLELKKTVESGQVQQKFAHGRSKMVRVEVKKRRTYASDELGRLAKVASEGEPGGRRGGGVRGAASANLTNEEKAARARALQDAIRADEAADLDVLEMEEVPTAEPVEQEPAGEGVEPALAETEAMTAPGEPVPGEVTPGEAVPGETVSGETAPTAAPEAAPAPAEQIDAEMREPAAPVEGTPAEEPAAAAAAPRAPAKAAPTARDRAAVAEPDAESEARARGRKTVKADPRRAAATPRRGGDQRRQSGKLTVSEALTDRGEERVRSLAAQRRARMKEKIKQQMYGAEALKVVRDVIIPETITVQELSNRMAERSSDVIKKLLNMGVIATLNQAIDGDTAELLVNEFGHNSKRVSEADVEIGLKGAVDATEALQTRPPVVTVMGHVDHGKTSLLDALRKTDVVAHEAGGITQHIGAYQITVPQGGKITFIDTPGHAAFTQMRARGANVTDIVVLVVAADDGIMPQTIEAISHAKAAGVPMIVAINKIDLPDAKTQRIRTDLLQHDIQLEDVGGETLAVEVSAKTGENLDKLVETILLQAELLDLRSNPDRPAEGVVVESKLERGRGPVATVLVQRGTLRVGDIFVAGSEWGRVRGLTDATGASLEAVEPGMPAELLGLGGTPNAGDELSVVENDARAREVSEFRKRKVREARVKPVGRSSFEHLFDQIREGAKKEVPLVIKADVHGSAEAIVGALDKLGTDEVTAQVLHSGVGGINESDVTLARASDALIIGFNVRANPQAREMAKRDGVEIRHYSIIYEVVDDIKAMMSGMLAPQLRENILGYAEIRQVFSITKVGKVAGCMVTEGLIRRGGKVRLLRDDTVIHEGDLSQLKRFKDDVREVKEGYECGAAFANYHDLQVGDKIECFEVQELVRHLD
jgi:translation initiation factor IF-2